MNYRHAYHAGNFADVLKHIVLMLCLEHLKLKEAPFRVIDTHAGAGRYRLDHDEAEKTGEWRGGIGRLSGPDAEPLPAAIAALLEPYLAAVRADNPDGGLTYYPGSPALVQSALRAGDALVANELHPDDAKLLQAVLAKDKLCKVSCMDGYVALKALLPPRERRGLVLIDPPYEEPGELIRMTSALAEALKRFATGIYLLWYPIKDEKPVARFHRGIRELTEAAGLPPPLKAEVLVRPARNASLLNGAGLVIVNPPFTLEGNLSAVLPILAARFGEQDKALCRLGCLVPAETLQRGTIRAVAGKTLSSR